MDNELKNAELALNTNPLKDQVEYLTEAVLNGFINPLDASLALKKIETILSKAKADIKDVALDKANEYGRDGFSNSVGKIEARNSASRYSFKHIDKWVEAKKTLTSIEDTAKLALKNNELMYDSEGVEIEPAHVSGGAQTIVITLNK